MLFRLGAFVGLLLAGALLSAGGEPASAGPNCTVDASVDSEEQQMLQLINQHRQANGLTLLVFSDSLNHAAAWKSQDLAVNGLLRP